MTNFPTACLFFTETSDLTGLGNPQYRGVVYSTSDVQEMVKQHKTDNWHCFVPANGTMYCCYDTKRGIHTEVQVSERYRQRIRCHTPTRVWTRLVDRILYSTPTLPEIEELEEEEGDGEDGHQ